MRPASPVIEAFASAEIVMAKNQPEYDPLPAIATDAGLVITRWELDEIDRDRIASGQSLYLAILTYGRPLQPVVLQVLRDDEMRDQVEKYWSAAEIRVHGPCYVSCPGCGRSWRLAEDSPWLATPGIQFLCSCGRAIHLIIDSPGPQDFPRPVDDKPVG